MAVKVVVEISSQIRREVIGNSCESSQLLTEGMHFAASDRFKGLDNHLSAIGKVSPFRQANGVVLNGCSNAHGAIIAFFTRMPIDEFASIFHLSALESPKVLTSDL